MDAVSGGQCTSGAAHCAAAPRVAFGTPLVTGDGAAIAAECFAASGSAFARSPEADGATYRGSLAARDDSCTPAAASLFEPGGSPAAAAVVVPAAPVTLLVGGSADAPGRVYPGVSIGALLDDASVPLVLVGEGSQRSFAMAVASLRRSWDNMTVTQLAALEAGFDALRATRCAFQAAVLGIIRNTDRAARLEAGGGYAGVREHMAAAVSELLVGGVMHALGGVDATSLHLHPALIGPASVVFFQCPCAGGARRKMRILVHRFLRSAGGCGPAWILIGILNNPWYAACYGVEDAAAEGYELLGVDVGYTARVLALGYVHEGEREIHDYVAPDHATLVFRRRG